MKKMELTMLIEKGENGYYVGQIQEYPPVMSQGETIDELKLNLKDALKLFWEVQKEQVEKFNQSLHLQPTDIKQNTNI